MPRNPEEILGRKGRFIMTKNFIIIVAVASTAALTASTTLAQDKGGRRGQILKKADTNSDGKLSIDELVKQASVRFDKADSDGDGEISLEEMTESIRRQRDEKRARRMLERMDFNGDGKVTKDEMDNRARKRFALMDRNDDGFVEKSELRSGRKGMRSGRKGERRNKHRRPADSDNL
jgi:hypothetical protein